MSCGIYCKGKCMFGIYNWAMHWRVRIIDSVPIKCTLQVVEKKFWLIKEKAFFPKAFKEVCHVSLVPLFHQTSLAYIPFSLFPALVFSITFSVPWVLSLLSVLFSHCSFSLFPFVLVFLSPLCFCNQNCDWAVFTRSSQGLASMTDSV